MLEGIGGRRRRGDRGWDGWMESLTRWTWVWVDSGSWWWTERPGALRFMGVTKSQTGLSDWSELNWIQVYALTNKAEEAEVPILWPLDAKTWLIGKDPDTGKDSGQKEKGATVDEMAEWHHQLNGHETDQTPGGSKGQGGLACCSPCCRKESDMTEWVNNNWTAVGFRKLNSRIFISLHCRTFFSTNIYFWKKFKYLTVLVLNFSMQDL